VLGGDLRAEGCHARAEAAQALLGPRLGGGVRADGAVDEASAAADNDGASLGGIPSPDVVLQGLPARFEPGLDATLPRLLTPVAQRAGDGGEGITDTTLGQPSPEVLADPGEDVEYGGREPSLDPGDQAAPARFEPGLDAALPRILSPTAQRASAGGEGVADTAPGQPSPEVLADPGEDVEHLERVPSEDAVDEVVPARVQGVVDGAPEAVRERGVGAQRAGEGGRGIAAATPATARAASPAADTEAAKDPVDEGLDPLVVDPLHCGAEDGLGLPVLQILLDGLPAVIQVVDDAGPDGH